MVYLALSVLFSSFIFVVFKLFAVYRINTLNAIIANYVTACLVGIAFYQGQIGITEVPKKAWFWGTIALGVLFIVVFNLMAATAQRVGVSVASVATKMSLVIPVLLGIFLYKERLSPWQVIGVFLALAAVYFASVKQHGMHLGKKSLLLPLLVFLGSGIIDSSIKYIQEIYISENEFSLFSATVFASAALVGLVFVSLKNLRKPLSIRGLDVLGGIALGVPNYFSIYFLLKALEQPNLGSASVFTINNVAIVMCSTFLGIVLFKEHISPRNWGGIALAVTSIILVASL